MATIIAFFVLIPLLGGIVAYFADRLGRTLGKKRLSLFGMRPRHTAEFLTVAAGVLIPLLTVLLALALSADFRDRLFKFEKLVSQEKNEKKQLEDERKQVDELKHNVDQAQKDYDQATSRFKDAQQRLTDTKKSLDQAQIVAKRYENQANVSSAQASQARAQVASAQTQYRSAQANLKTVQSSLSSAKSNLDAAKKNYDDLKRSFDDLDAKRAKADADNRRLGNENSKLTTENARLAEESRQTAQKLSDLNAKVAQAQADLKTAQTQVSQAESAMADLFAKAHYESTQSRNAPLVFSIGDVLDRHVTNAPLSRDQARALLDSIIRDVRDRVDKAGVSTEGTGPVAGLMPIKREGTDVIEKTVDQQIEELLSVLTSGPSRSLVIDAYCGWNIFHGDPAVPFVLKAWDNPIVYAKNTIIAETYVDGRLSDEQIYQAIVSFISDKVQLRARQDEMLPLISKGEASLGSVPSSEIFDLLGRIRSTGRSVSLVAYAKDDIRRSGPLVLGFRLR